MQPIRVTGYSGKQYEYRAISASEPAIHFPGNFLFVTSKDDGMQIVFAGEANNVHESLASPEIGALFARAVERYGQAVIFDRLNTNDAARKSAVWPAAASRARSVR
jgi:hypothetical protein